MSRILGCRAVGPYNFNDTLNGDRYLEFFREGLISVLAVLHPNLQHPDLLNDSIWCQEDGAPPHYAAPVRQYMNQVFSNRRVGRRGFVEWPARSPDLSPRDYFLCLSIPFKCKVFATKPADIDELKRRISVECREIPPAVLNRNLFCVFRIARS
ncbi:hypothetical protein ANN_03305 [Periplaneta americana]|uniref:Uncharacterized protein n=1 Tax=Periplaneta americana TaxID=6978 RepID=A0ABQ8TYR2_PERAM|nr:hypothetical protein ANN_03305 [Periplaneta americana]